MRFSRHDGQVARKTRPISWIKAARGIKTPQREIDLIQDRLKRLAEML
jgi:hypothetical protein